MPNGPPKGSGGTDSEVFVLGAGFSRAISSAMPLMSDLGVEVATRIDRENDLERFGGNLETWMDYLAERHPWLTESQSLKNQAVFLDVSETISRILIEKQNAAVKDERPPEWLAELVRYWLDSQTTVVSLNYDLLVEKATGFVVHRVNGGSGGSYSSLYPRGIASIRLHSVPEGASWGHEAIRDPFKLVKPHGSLSWFRSDDPAGRGSAYEVHLASYWRGDDQARIIESAPGKVPLIAPPTAGKSSWLGHEYLRIQWTEAVDALRTASTVTFVGYSLPRTDSALRLALMDSVSAERIRVVDVSEAVSGRYEELFHEVDVETIISPDAVTQLVDHLTPSRS